jgi:NDP-mannose synthase
MHIPVKCRAVIMAGGRSERMRRTAGPLHKALVPVHGMPLLERNLSALLAEAFDDIIVAISSSEPEVGRYVESSCRRLAESQGARLEVLREETALGTIGAAREAIGDAEALLVVNVDNLTSLPLRAFVRFHSDRNATLTIAAHQEPFQIPFGELRLNGDGVEQYVEKPVKPIWISSGTYVLSREACAFIPPGRRTNVPELVSKLITAKMRVVAFCHDSAWIDVNHAEALKKAELLVASGDIPAPHA